MSNFTMQDVYALRSLTRSTDEYARYGKLSRTGWYIHCLRLSRLADRIEAKITGEMPEDRWTEPDWRDRVGPPHSDGWLTVNR